MSGIFTHLAHAHTHRNTLTHTETQVFHSQVGVVAVFAVSRLVPAVSCSLVYSLSLPPLVVEPSDPP